VAPRLSADLRAFFRIEGKPIVANTEGKGWRVEFRLQADG
jgi:hypothetical protein